MLAVLTAFIATPKLVIAGEGAPKISYAAKKQGRVGFQIKTQEETVAAQDIETTNPADIEPAAGVEEQAAPQEDKVAKSIKLPRKN